MKDMSIIKKLSLNKKTVAHLKDNDLKKAIGGGINPVSQKILPGSGCVVCSISCGIPC